MPIVAGDIEFRLSTPAGSAGNSLAQADPDASLGKYMSTTAIVDATSENLFDNVTGEENANSIVEYRCIFIYNDHPTLTLSAATVWIQSEVPGGTNIAIGLDPAGVVDRDDASAQAAEVADETTAPVGVTFTAPTSKPSGLIIGAIPALDCAAVWIRRTASNSAALADDGGVIRVEGDTPA